MITSTMKKYLISVALLMLLLPKVFGQQKEAQKNFSPFNKKTYLGISWNQYWGTIKGKDLPEDYFAKPCLGYNLQFHYFPVSFIGFGIGGGFQQRGAGIITPDKSGGSFTHPWESPVGDPDSTYRRRLRYNAIEFPVLITIRSPKDIIRGVRPSGSAGISFIKPTKVHDFFFSVEDGFHTDQIVDNLYSKKDLATQLTLGADIDAGGSAILQVHLVWSKGSRNIFAANQGNGRLETIGFRVQFIY